MSRHKKLNIVSILLLLVLIILDVVADISIGWYLLLALFYISINTIGSFVLSAEFFLPVKSIGNNFGKRIAITFDDGPIHGQTERILKILDQYQVKAAFFCIGNRMVKNAELVKQLDEAGHIIGNHTYYHKSTIGFMSRKKIADELYETDQQGEKITGRKLRFFRPPYGVTNPMIAKAVTNGHYLTIGWSVRSFDTIIKDPGRLMKRVTGSLTSGDIILFHDYSESMIEILPACIEFAFKNGFEIVRLDELLNETPYR